jgi:hypothetical protein
MITRGDDDREIALLVGRIRTGYRLLLANGEYDWRFNESDEEAADIIWSALHAEYMRGVMEASGCCMTCGEKDRSKCHCGEVE